MYEGVEKSTVLQSREVMKKLGNLPTCRENPQGLEENTQDCG